MTALGNPRHEAFAQGVAKGMTADEAYTAAGYKPNRGNAARMKANESILARIDELIEASASLAEIDLARTLKELVRLGTSDIRKLFDGNGALIPICDLDDDTAAALASVEVVTKRLPANGDEPPEVEYVHKLKFWDKNSALDKIAKHLGMFVDRVDHTSSDGSMSPQNPDEVRAELAKLRALYSK